MNQRGHRQSPKDQCSNLLIWQQQSGLSSSFSRHRHAASRKRKRLSNRYSHDQPQCNCVVSTSLVSICCWIIASSCCIRTSTTVAVKASTFCYREVPELSLDRIPTVFHMHSTMKPPQQRPYHLVNELSRVRIMEHEQQQSLFLLHRITSGGGQEDHVRRDEEVSDNDGQNFDDALDDYISDLIAEVEGENDDTGETDHETDHSAGNADAENDSDANETLKKMPKGVQSKQKRQKLKMVKGQHRSTDYSKKDTVASRGETVPRKQAKNKTTKKMKKTTKDSKTKDDSTIQAESSTEIRSKDPSKQEDRSPHIQPNAVAEKKIQQPKQEMRLPPPPPNAIYRFLLRRGPIGHILVMTLVLITEFINCYLPPLANSLAYLWTRYGPKAPPPRPRVESRRKVTRSERKAASRQADVYALHQLKQLGNVQQAKYRHVSTSFLRRHGLGPFAATAMASKKMEETNADTKSTKKGISEPAKAETFLDKIITPFSKQQQAQPKKNVRDDDVNWVIQALTKKTKGKNKKNGKPFLTEEVQEDILQTITSEQQKKKKTTQRASTGFSRRDVDGGDEDSGGFVARTLRAASSGTNSLLLSRTLLGAYPGDAVPPSEAASADGVQNLARKYGWGEWEDDEFSDEYDLDDDDNPPPFNLLGQRNKKRMRKKRAYFPVVGINADNDEQTNDFTFGLPFLDDDEHEQDVSGSDVLATPSRKHGTSRKLRKKHSSTIPGVMGGREKKKPTLGIGFEFGGGSSSFEAGINFKGKLSNTNRHNRGTTNAFDNRRRVDRTPESPSPILTNRQAVVDRLKNKMSRNKATSILDRNGKSPLLRDDMKQSVRMVRPAMDQLNEARRKPKRNHGRDDVD